MHFFFKYHGLGLGPLASSVLQLTQSKRLCGHTVTQHIST